MFLLVKCERIRYIFMLHVLHLFATAITIEKIRICNSTLHRGALMNACTLNSKWDMNFHVEEFYFVEYSETIFPHSCRPPCSLYSFLYFFHFLLSDWSRFLLVFCCQKKKTVFNCNFLLQNSKWDFMCAICIMQISIYVSGGTSARYVTILRIMTTYENF